MKKLIFVLMVVLILPLFMINSNADCYDDGCGAFNPKSMSYVYPAFPLCTVTVFYETRMCNGIWEFRFKYLHFLDPTNCNGVCTSLVNWLWPNGIQSSPNTGRAKSVFDAAFDEYCLQTYAGIVSNYIEEEMDLSDLDCNHPKTTFSRFEGSCWSLCSGYMPEPDDYMILKMVNCTADVCCQFTKSYCFENGQIVVSYETIPPINQTNCTNENPPACDFPEDIEFPQQGNCEPNCQIL